MKFVDMELKDIQKEVQRKIGRNVLCFQQVEHMLKHLIPRAKMEGESIESLRQKFSRDNDAVKKKTLGQLIGQFMEELHVTPEDINLNDESENIVSWSMSFRIDMDEDTFKKRQLALAELVNTRNMLIHHLVPHFDLSSIDGCISAVTQLDDQHEQVQPEITFLRSCIATMKEVYLESIGELVKKD